MVAKKTAKKTAKASAKTAVKTAVKTATTAKAAKKTPSAVRTPAAKPPAKRAATARRTSPAKAAKRTAPAKKAAARKAPAAKAADTKAPAKSAAKTSAVRTSAAKAPARKAAPAKPAPVRAEGAPVRPAELMVRPGEEPWTAAEVDEAREELRAESARLRTEIQQSEAAVSGLMRDSGDGAGDDQADVGTKNISREHEMSLADNAREMLRQTERALGRLDDGTYGRCESCGNPIGKARVRAFPRATLCVECKQRTERR